MSGAEVLAGQVLAKVMSRSMDRHAGVVEERAGSTELTPGPPTMLNLGNEVRLGWKTDT